MTTSFQYKKKIIYQSNKFQLISVYLTKQFSKYLYLLIEIIFSITFYFIYFISNSIKTNN